MKRKVEKKEFYWPGHYGHAFVHFFGDVHCPMDEEECRMMDEEGCMLPLDADFIYHGKTQRICGCRKKNFSKILMECEGLTYDQAATRINNYLIESDKKGELDVLLMERRD